MTTLSVFFRGLTGSPRPRLRALLSAGLLGSAALLGGCKKDDAQATDTSPILRIVSPVASAVVAPGVGRPGTGSFDGAGFLVNLELVT